MSFFALAIAQCHASTSPAKNQKEATQVSVTASDSPKLSQNKTRNIKKEQVKQLDFFKKTEQKDDFSFQPAVKFVLTWGIAWLCVRLLIPFFDGDWNNEDKYLLNSCLATLALEITTYIIYAIYTLIQKLFAYLLSDPSKKAASPPTATQGVLRWKEFLLQKIWWIAGAGVNIIAVLLAWWYLWGESSNVAPAHNLQDSEIQDEGQQAESGSDDDDPDVLNLGQRRLRGRQMRYNQSFANVPRQ